MTNKEASEWFKKRAQETMMPGAREAFKLAAEALAKADVSDKNVGELISRQQAIDEGMSYINGDCFCDKEDFAKYIEFIEQMPPAQLGTNLAEVGTDLISRQAALDIAFKYCPDDDGTCSEAGTDLRDMLDELENLPPAQPAIVPCNYVEACNVATMDKSISAYTYLSVLADLKDHGFVLVDMREVTI